MLETTLSRRPPGLRTTHQLWAEADPTDLEGIDPQLLTAMRRPTDTDALFTYALDRLIDSVLTDKA